MAHRQDRISIRNPEEGIRRLAFGMVLHGRRPAAESCSDRPPGVQQGSSEETPKLALAEPSTGGRQGRPLFDGPNKVTGPCRVDHDWSHSNIHYAGGAATTIQGPPHVRFQRGGRCHPSWPQRAGFGRRPGDDPVRPVQRGEGRLPPC